MPIQYTPLANSNYLDYDSYRSDAPSPTGAGAIGNFTFNVALVLDRANDPTALLQSDWASRQQQLETLTDSGTLWSTYGANAAAYNQVLSQLGGLGIHTVNQIDPVNGYVSSAELRTIWVQVNQSNFATLFGTPLVAGHDQAGNAVAYWQGNLSLPQSLASLGVKGFRSTPTCSARCWRHRAPERRRRCRRARKASATARRATTSSSTRSRSPRASTISPCRAPRDPSSGDAVGTGTIGLLEPGIGSALGPDTPAGEFQSLLDAYRVMVGISTSGHVTTIALGGQQVTSDAGERSLDVGVATAINPQSPLVLYAGSGFSGNANADAYTAYQAAFWDTANDPTSFPRPDRFHPTMAAPGSPFLFAVDQLFVDAALRGITVLTSVGDGGSGGWTGDGLTNVVSTRGSPYDLMVGGTSLSTLAAAGADPTLADILTLVMAAIWRRSGTWSPAASPLCLASSGPASHFVEAVWNTYVLNGSTFCKGRRRISEYLAGAGGADFKPCRAVLPERFRPGADDRRPGRPGWPRPARRFRQRRRQPVLRRAASGDGRPARRRGNERVGAAVGRAGRAVQTIFHDQGLPNLGYMNDLLYIAAAIAPGSFNDVTLGNNVSSFARRHLSDAETAPRSRPPATATRPAGLRPRDGAGLAQRLLLARALTDIAHSEMWFGSAPHVIDWDRPRRLDQRRRPEPIAADCVPPASMSACISDRMPSASSAPPGKLRLDEPDGRAIAAGGLRSGLVIMFDKQAQGALAAADASRARRSRCRRRRRPRRSRGA